MRRTKIVATIGPRSRDEVTLRKIIDAGVDVVRLNFAHDTPDAHRRAAATARSVAREAGKVVGVLVDLPGPKMRTGPIRGSEALLHAGDRFVLASGETDREGDARRVGTTVPDLGAMVAVGQEIFLADGEIVLEVTDVRGGDVETKIVRGGTLRSRKGLHLPHSEASIDAFTPDDRRAVSHCVEMRPDMIGLSFVRDADDVERARSALPESGFRPLLVAKIETASAVANLESIVAAADAVMVARGDLGIQISLPRVPLVQKEIIRTCNEHGKPVITATQMLESMTDALLPTRAEVTDVANAVLDGTDALMLSEETAVGHDPPEAVRVMSEIAAFSETRLRRHGTAVRWHAGDDRVSWAVAHAAVQAAEDLQVAAILCPTRSGATPRRVAAFRPRMPVVALSANLDALGGLSLVWGCRPVEMPEWPAVHDLTKDVERTVAAAREKGIAHAGELAAVVWGSAGPRARGTDSLRIVRA